MYKLFICLRYLRSRVIAYFAVLGVALCVAMMLIVTSVMNGFLDKIERAAKGLFSDILVESSGLSGFGRYDEFAAELTRKVPEVEASSPFILTYGILRIPGGGLDHRQTVQIAGIRLPDRAHVSDFEEGLFVQADWPEPSFDPPIAKILVRLEQETAATEKLLKSVSDAAHDGGQSQENATLRKNLRTAIWYQQDSRILLTRAAKYQGAMVELHEKIVEARAKAGPDSEIVDELQELMTGPDGLEAVAGIKGPANRVILGTGLTPLIFRTEEGRTVRVITPGHKVELMILPLGRRLIGAADMAPTSAVFTVVDDCRTDVSSIDSNIVYVPFETLQRLNNMDTEYSADQPGEVVRAARCSQLHIKVKGPFAKGARLLEVRRKIEESLVEFRGRFPGDVPASVTVMTWRQRQAKLLGSIANQRTLSVIIVGIVSVVAVVLIFVIFYMIVVQKTKDIGILKAVGASSSGIGQIFLVYGAAIGLVGAALGIIGGYYFVRHINLIQDIIDKWFGYRVWSREWFMFERIPDSVDWSAAGVIVVGSIVAGLLGAVIPAIRAGRMQPVEALRYE